MAGTEVAVGGRFDGVVERRLLPGEPAGRRDPVSVRNGGSSPATAYVRVEYYSGGTGPTSGAYRPELTW